VLNLEVLTVYKFIYSGNNERPKVRRKLLKRVVGASGFEPPSFWSRTRFQYLCLPKTRFSLILLNLIGRRDSVLMPCLPSFSRSFLRFDKDFEPARRFTLRFLPCGTSSWSSRDLVVVIASI
jgi:hypothetical protein